MARKRSKKSKKKRKQKSSPSTKKEIREPPLPKVPEKRDIPVYDFIEDHNVDTGWGLEECLNNFMSCMKRKEFHRWEAVVRQEQGLPLTDEQEDLVDGLITFYDDDDEGEGEEVEPILYIDGLPRPSEPWYEILNKVLPKLVLTPFKTYETHYEIYNYGWIEIVECLEEYAQGLSLPEGITSPVDAIPPNIRHRLWLQYCFDELSGLGQVEEATLANENQKSGRIRGFIEALNEYKESVEYFDLTLEGLFEFVELPPQDEKILVECMLQELGMKSQSLNKEKLFSGS